MDLIKNITLLQRYYSHPFKKISPNAILVTDASEITYSIVNDEQPVLTLESVEQNFFPRERYVDIGFNSYEITKNKKLFNVYSNIKVDVILFLEKNDLIDNDTYMLFKECTLYTVYRSSLYNKVYNDDGSSRQLLRYEDNNKKQYISGKAKDVIITQVNS